LPDDDVGAVATAWMDEWLDADAGLLWNMPGSYDELCAPRSIHLVPNSAWYAVGLLRRGGPGDVERAARTIHAICATQYDAPGTVWHGTFARFLEWPAPSGDAVMWVDYDPNWRQFVGTTFALVLGELATALPAATVDAARAAIALAVDGEPEGRVPASYSNIALMKAWLDVEAGRTAEGEAFAEEVITLFRRHGAFLEYGSPTYYGIDLYALALWRSRSSSAALRAWGEEMEDALWRDVARWYHPGLRNLCGPYARAYGMDMTSYAALLGLWMWDALGEPGVAPFPSTAGPFEHSHDLCLGPCVSLLGSRVPPDVLPALTRPPTTHHIEQVIDDDLGFVATGWLTEDLMVGGARGGGARASGQYHPATVHWRAPDGTVGWLRLVHEGPLDATVRDGGALEVTTSDHKRRGPCDTTVVSSHPGTFTAERWTFPGLTIDVHGPLPTSPTGVLTTVGPTTFVLASTSSDMRAE
jgi:hypothetical protein